MYIIAHRGYHNDIIEPNSFEALRTALEKGYGIETDFRDYLGKLVVSHNIADQGCFDADKLFEMFSKYNSNSYIAINIKADGLKDLISNYINMNKITNYFLFDMSIPQNIEIRETKLQYFCRQSEVEITPVLYDDSMGVWVDGFWSYDWITEELLQGHLKNNKMVCIVSPELHGFSDYKQFWEKLKKYHIDFDKIMICTDFPDEARSYFYE